jgi:hypothetical protein
MTVIVYKGIRGIWTATGEIKVGSTTYPDRVSFKWPGPANEDHVTG